MVKIIIKQGDPSELYSESNDFFQSYIRKDRQTFPALTPREIKEQIKKRQISPGEKIPATEFEDPEPDPIKHLKKEEKGDARQGPLKQIKQYRSGGEEEGKKERR